MESSDGHEQPNGGYTIHGHVHHIRSRWCGVAVRRHGDGQSLRKAPGNEASIVEEQHTMVHMQRMRNEAAMVERDLDGLSAGAVCEFDGEGAAVSLECLGAEDDVFGPLGCVGALEVWRCVDLDAELGHVVL